MEDPSKHSYIVMEEKAYRLQITLSDLNGIDPIIHRNAQSGIVNGVLDNFENRDRPVDFAETSKLVRELQIVREKFLRSRHLDSVFRPRAFNALTIAALKLANDAELRE